VEGLEVMLWVRVSEKSSSQGWVVASMIVGLKLGHCGSGSQVVAFVLLWEGAGFLTIWWQWV